MRIITAIGALLVLGAQLQGQTIGQNDIMVIGSSYSLHTSSFISLAPGMNMTWDASQLTSQGTLGGSFIAPSGTPYVASFPGANLASTDGAAYTYYEKSAAGLDLVGFATGGTVLPYQNPERFFAFPMSYQSQWTDPFSSSFVSQGVSFQRSGTVQGIADGFGTLIMPYGTVTNVLRVHAVEDFMDIGGGTTIEYDFINDYYFKPGVGWVILMVSDLTTTTFGFPVQQQQSLFMDATGVGIAEALAQDIGIDVFPNPASDRIEVVYGASGRLTLELVDATGRTVQVLELGQRAPGVHRDVVDIAGYSAGLYVLRIRNEAGETGTKRLIIR